MSELIAEHFVGREINVFGTTPSSGKENFLGGGYLRGVKEGLLLLSEQRDEPIDLVIMVSAVTVIALMKHEPDEPRVSPGTARC